MKSKSIKANNFFMIGSIVMMILVLLLVFFVLMWSFKISGNKSRQYRDTYQIVVGESVLGKGVSLYVNDSLIFSGTPDAVMKLDVGRFADENTLLAVDLETDMVSLIELPDKGCLIKLHRNGSEFTGTIENK